MCIVKWWWKHQPNCGMERSLLYPYNVVFEPNNMVVIAIGTATVTSLAADDAMRHTVIVRARICCHCRNVDSALVLCLVKDINGRGHHNQSLGLDCSHCP